MELITAITALTTALSVGLMTVVQAPEAVELSAIMLEVVVAIAVAIGEATIQAVAVALAA